MPDALNRLRVGFNNLLGLAKWTNLLDRIFRPVIGPDHLVYQPVRTGR